MGLRWTKACLWGAVAVMPTPVWAQQSSSTQARNTSEEEIVVTARRREESLEDVPVATSVLSAEQQELLVLDNMGDYLRQFAGALLVNSGPDYLSDISFRGQGGGRTGFSESAAGIYRNGIYSAGGGFGGRSLSRLDLFDNERVEAYRGPQGALYGRNAVGGAVNVVSRRPGYALGAWGTAEYTDVDRSTLEGVVNVPIVQDLLAVRVGGFVVDQSQGDIQDVNTGAYVDAQEYRALRAAARLNFLPGWEGRLTFETSYSEGPSFSGLGQRTPLGLPAGRRTDPSPFKRTASRPSEVQIKEDSIFAEIDGDVGFVTLSAVFAHKERDGSRTDDLDHFLGFEGVPNVDIAVDQAEDFNRDGVEVRAASPSGKPLTWLIGADYQTFTSDVFTGNSGQAPAPPALKLLALRRDVQAEKLKSHSVFGLASYEFTDRLTASVEARYQRDEKTFMFQRTELVASPKLTANPAWKRFLPAATLSYEVTQDQTIYARIATAYRPGGFNNNVTNVNFLSYDPEDTTGFEVGYKGRIPSLALRFDLAGYYNRNKDMQLVTQASVMDTGVILQSAGDARLWGVEAQVNGRIRLGSRGRLKYGISATHQDGKFDDGTKVIVQGRLVDLSGLRVDRNRDLILNLSAFYETDLGAGLAMFGGGSLRLERGGFENATGGSSDPTARTLAEYELLDARIGITGNGWQLSAFGKNMLDQTFSVAAINGNLYYNERQRYGLELRVNFGGER